MKMAILAAGLAALAASGAARPDDEPTYGVTVQLDRV